MARRYIRCEELRFGSSNVEYEEGRFRKEVIWSILQFLREKSILKLVRTVFFEENSVDFGAWDDLEHEFDSDFEMMDIHYDVSESSYCKYY